MLHKKSLYQRHLKIDKKNKNIDHQHKLQLSMIVSNMHQHFPNFQKVRRFVDQPEQKATPNTLIKTELGTKIGFKRKYNSVQKIEEN